MQNDVRLTVSLPPLLQRVREQQPPGVPLAAMPRARHGTHGHQLIGGAGRAQDVHSIGENIDAGANRSEEHTSELQSQ